MTCTELGLHYLAIIHSWHSDASYDRMYVNKICDVLCKRNYYFLLHQNFQLEAYMLKVKILSAMMRMSSNFNYQTISNR